MKILGNIIWFLFGGFISAILFAVFGLLWCCTIVGIPIGVQCFKAAGLMLAPFGRDVVYGGGPVSCLLNVLWLLFGGLVIAMNCCVWGMLFCVTIVGIPFGLQHFKFAKLALMPFGAKIT